jgi:hypothetical protein
MQRETERKKMDLFLLCDSKQSPGGTHDDVMVMECQGGEEKGEPQ